MRCRNPLGWGTVLESRWVFWDFCSFTWVSGLFVYPPGPILASAFLWRCFCRQKLPCKRKNPRTSLGCRSSRHKQQHITSRVQFVGTASRHPKLGSIRQLPPFAWAVAADTTLSSPRSLKDAFLRPYLGVCVSVEVFLSTENSL